MILTRAWARVALLVLSSFQPVQAALAYVDNSTNVSAGTSPVSAGTLSNGLRYVIVKSARKDGKVSVRCHIEAGSAQSPFHKSDTAHFVEHLALTYSTNRENQRISFVERLENLGVSLGQDIGAVTYPNYTFYDMVVPSEILTVSLQKCRYIFGDFVVTNEEFRKQKGIIAAESYDNYEPSSTAILLAGLRRVTGSTQFPELYREKLASIDDMTVADVRNFYKRWYRPDREIILIEGDVDLDVWERRVRTLFGDIPKSRFALPNAEEFIQPEYLWIPVPGQEVMRAYLRIGVEDHGERDPPLDPRTSTVKWAAQWMVRRRVSNVLAANRHLTDDAFIVPNSIFADVDNMSISFATFPEAFEQVLGKVVAELAGMNEVPVAESEMDLVRAAIRTFDRKEDTKDAYFRGALRGNPGSIAPGDLKPDPAFAQVVRRSEIQRELRRLTSLNNMRTILLGGSDQPPASLSGPAIRDSLVSYFSGNPALSLCPETHLGGQAGDARLSEEGGKKRIIAGNGMSISLEPDPQSEAISINVITPTVQFDDVALRFGALEMQALVEASGLTSLSGDCFERLLKRQEISRQVSTSLNSSVTMSSELSDVDTLFQLLALHLGSIPVTADGLRRAELKRRLTGRPLGLGSSEVGPQYWLATGRAIPEHAMADAGKVPTMEQAARIWAAYYGDFAKLNIEVRGNFAVEDALKATQAYLAGLSPLSGGAMTSKRAVRHEYGTFVYRRPDQAGTRIKILFNAPLTNADQAAIVMALGPLAQTRFLYRLREKEAVGYGPASSFVSTDRLATLTVGDTIEPANRAAFEEASCDELQRWQREGFNRREAASLSSFGKGVTPKNALEFLRAFSCARSATFVVEPQRRESLM